ncbi:hypothetical protein MHC_06011 [Mycoplasma haemocanis str. Illinois]|uniref:Uncharacterized protein n=1 Tax=Mycoplasma haemocanis (strain Illinois) TaxID=1111676 RepID=I6QUM3_MYCHN|nr:hypothetical protein MHC_06011 [Mycoplasma haemocanis str. Illinois]
MIFCKKMRNKIEGGKDLGNRQLKYIGFCDRDEFIPVSKDMSKRFYWVDQLAQVKYNPSDFTFWDRLFEEVGERSHKLHELRKQGYVGDLPEVLGRAKRECQVLRDKFSSKDKFTEEDLKIEIPKCISSLKTTR